MSALEELNTALECILGARQALGRAVARDGLPEDRAEAMMLKHLVRKVDVRLAGLHAELAAVANTRREVER